MAVTCVDAERSTPSMRRCGNTIHSNYVSDHRCVKEHEHTGDCWFGFGIPRLDYVGTKNTPMGSMHPHIALYRIVPWPYAEVVE